MTPDPATRVQKLAAHSHVFGCECRSDYDDERCVKLCVRLQGAIAALTEPPGLGPETGPDVNPSRMATHDALCRFFSAISGDMSDADEIDAYDLWETAKKAGLARQVPYDEAKHSHIEDVGDDDFVWELTEAGNRAVGRANDLERQSAATPRSEAPATHDGPDGGRICCAADGWPGMKHAAGCPQPTGGCRDDPGDRPRGPAADVLDVLRVRTRGRGAARGKRAAMSEHESSYTNDCTNTRRCVTGDAEVQALRAALAEARAALAATRNFERMRTLLADARRERDEARRALKDVLTRFPDAETLAAITPKGAERVRYCPMLKWRTPRVADVLRWRAALGRPAPDGEPR